MLDISFYVKIMILLSSFPVIHLFPTLLPDLYFFSSCSLNISLSCDTTMTKRTLKWSGHTEKEDFRCQCLKELNTKCHSGDKGHLLEDFPYRYIQPENCVTAEFLGKANVSSLW